MQQRETGKTLQMDKPRDPKDVYLEFWRAAEAFVARRQAKRAAQGLPPEPEPKVSRKRGQPEYTAYWSFPEPLAPRLGPNQMTAQSFVAWMDATGCDSAAAVVRKLGCKRRMAEVWVNAARTGQVIDVDRVFAFAMAAAAAGLEPWPAEAKGAPPTDAGAPGDKG